MAPTGWGGNARAQPFQTHTHHHHHHLNNNNASPPPNDTTTYNTCAFIQDCGKALRLPQLSIATALAFYHKFYRVNSYKDYDRFNIAATCLFLASKVEESPKKLKDVVLETMRAEKKAAGEKLNEADSKELLERKDKVLVTERILLQTLNFNLSLEHPYKPLLAYVRATGGTRSLAQVAWNYINDSLRTTICLDFEPRAVAAAVFALAVEHETAQGQAPSSSKVADVHKAFQVEQRAVSQVTHRIRELYQQQGGIRVGKPHTASNGNVGEGTQAAAKGNIPVTVSVECPPSSSVGVLKESTAIAAPPSPASAATAPLEEPPCTFSDPQTTKTDSAAPMPPSIGSKRSSSPAGIAPPETSRQDGPRSMIAGAPPSKRPRDE